MFASRLRWIICKEYRLQCRKLWLLLIEFVFPLILTISVASLKLLLKQDEYNATTYESIPVHGNYLDLKATVVDGLLMESATFSPVFIYYAPNTSRINKLMERMNEKLSSESLLNNNGEECSKNKDSVSPENYTPPIDLQFIFEGYENPISLDSSVFQILIKSYPTSFYAAIIFDDDFALNDNNDNGTSTVNLKYDLRFPFELRNTKPDSADSTMSASGLVYTWATENDFRNEAGEFNPYPNSNDGGIPSYWREGFITLQRALDYVLIEAVSPKSVCFLSNSSLTLKRFPFLPYKSVPVTKLMPFLFPAILLLNYAASILCIVRELCAEKETGLSAYLQAIVGLSRTTQEFAHFLLILTKLTIVAIFSTILLRFTIFEYSNIFLLGIFLLLYTINAITFAFTIASFFNTANNATLCACVLWFLSYGPCFYVGSKFSLLTSYYQSILFMVLPNGASAAFSYFLTVLEIRNEGLNWRNVTTFTIGSTKCTTLEIYACLFVSSMILLIIRLAKEIFVQNKFNCGFSMLGDWSSELPSVTVGQSDSTKHIESILNQQHSSPSINCQNVTKIYSNTISSKATLALDNLSMNIFPGELTVILGHNGAGKSTLMNMLTGVTQVTKGTVRINEISLNASSINNIRISIGYCPQYSFLIDDFTVLEHLELFSMLKNGFYDRTKGRNLLTKLDLMKKRHEKAKRLSGGQKRRLCLAIALLNSVSIVLLDEVTSGVDPNGKFEILDVIRSEKKPDGGTTNKSFVLVTHYVDEAEMLADRIAILSDGRLKCMGTNLFLKNKYGNDYRLSFKFGSTIDHCALTLIAKELLKVIQLYFVETVICTTSKNSAVYSLKGNIFKQFDSLRDLMMNLESAKSSLNIKSISIFTPTMHDVYVNAINESCGEKFTQNEDSNETDVVFFKSDRTVTGLSLLIQQLGAIVHKQALYSIRRLHCVLAQFLLLLCTTGCSFLLSRFFSTLNSTPSANQLNLQPFHGTKVLLRADSVNTAQGLSFVQTISNILSAYDIHTQTVGLVDNENFDEYIFEQVNFKGSSFYYTNFLALSILENETGIHVTSYFNNKAVHIDAIIINLFSNAILRANNSYVNNSSVGQCFNCSITASNHPLSQTTVLFYSFGEDFIIILCLAVGLAFFVANFASNLVEERICGAKRLQIMCGLRYLPYWFGTFISDFVLHSIACCMIIILWALCGYDLLIADGAWYDLLLLLILYVWAILPFVYCCSFVFNNVAAAITLTTTFNLFLGLIPTLISMVLIALSIKKEPLISVEDKFTCALSSILPQFTLSKAITTYYGSRLILKQCQMMDVCEYLESPSINKHFRVTKHARQWNSPGIGRFLACLAWQGMGYWILLIAVEMSDYFLNAIFGDCFTSVINDAIQSRKGPQIIDDQSEYVLHVRDVNIRYPNQSGCVVKNLNFFVNRREIFGLNGENGSGKTSMFKLLTGQLVASSGNVVINGRYNIVSNWRQVWDNIGYCPQFDALLDVMTARECVRHFAKLRGISLEDIPDIVDSLINAIGLDTGDKIVKYYSSGNKRKLSLCLALLGAPPLILLDEPTSGVDPIGRKKVWKILQAIKHLGCGIVLTSHDMDECETLCDRMLLLVGGNSYDCGAVRDDGYWLNRCYDDGRARYWLKFALKHVTEAETFEEAVTLLFPDAQLQRRPNVLQFHFLMPKPNDNGDESSWSFILSKIDQLRTSFELVDMSICEQSLADAFIHVVKKNQAKT